MAVILAAKRLRPKTYSLAIYLVAFVLLVQVAALISIFYFRHMVVRTDNPNAYYSANTNPASGESALPATARTVSEAAPMASSANLKILPSISPGRLSVPEPQDNRQTIMSLNDDASRYRREGNFKLAENSLMKAEEMDPHEPITLTSMAMLMEAENQDSKARTYWQRIIDLGPNIGNAYTLASEQILILDSKSRSREAAEEAHCLFIDQAEKSFPNPSDKNEFTLRIGITSTQDQTVIDPGKVLVKLYFYEKLPDETIVPSIGNLKVSFESAVQNWNKNKTETLVARYALTPELIDSSKREYYGYMLRIFYDGKLQDEHAEPENLLRFFPLSPTP